MIEKKRLAIFSLATPSPSPPMSHPATRRGDSVLNMLILCTLLIVFWGVHSFVSDVLAIAHAS